MNAVEARAREILERLKGRNMKFLTDRLGGILVEQAQVAFLRQRLGNNFPWVEKYPNQTGPFINVARAVADFQKGMKAPSAAAFVRRPALLNTRSLYNSIYATTTARTKVTHGAKSPRAKFHQHGLVTTQNVSDAAKQRIKEWSAGEGERYADKLAFVVRPNNTTVDTEVNQRPFIGITDETEPKLVRRVEAYLNA